MIDLSYLNNNASPFEAVDGGSVDVFEVKTSPSVYSQQSVIGAQVALEDSANILNYPPVQVFPAPVQGSSSPNTFFMLGAAAFVLWLIFGKRRKSK